MYETFEHTADIGLRARADTPSELFAEMGRALFALIVVNLDEVRSVEHFTIELTAERQDDLLFDWLAELLYRFETEHVVLATFEIEVDDGRLRATVGGERLDRQRHTLDMEVKAITYHALRLERDAHGWLAEVIVDI